MRSRSSDNDLSRARHHRAGELPRSDSHRRSRSPREEDRPHERRRRSPGRHRSYKDDHEKRDRNRRVVSPGIEPRHHRDDQRRSSHHHSHRRRSSRSLSPPDLPPLSKRSNAPLPSQQAAFNNESAPDGTEPPPEPTVQKPNYNPTGKLAAETNTVANTKIVLKYNEPPESRLPSSQQPWRMYVFKDSSIIDTLPLHTRPCWLFGRERAVVDFATEHPSCSKQHAVLQFRYVEKVGEWGERKGWVKPYVIDLESANGTWVNGERVPERRYVEVMSGDVITFGESTREYVVLVPPKEEKK